MFAAPRDEADVMHAIVDRAVGHVIADIRSQQTHDVEFSQGEIDVDRVPERPADPGLQHQPSAMLGFIDFELGWSLGGFDDDTDAFGENWHTARLVDEVESAAIESEVLVAGR